MLAISINPSMAKSGQAVIYCVPTCRYLSWILVLLSTDNKMKDIDHKTSLL